MSAYKLSTAVFKLTLTVMSLNCLEKRASPLVSYEHDRQINKLSLNGDEPFVLFYEDSHVSKLAFFQTNTAVTPFHNVPAKPAPVTLAAMTVTSLNCWLSPVTVINWRQYYCDFRAVNATENASLSMALWAYHCRSRCKVAHEPSVH